MIFNMFRGDIIADLHCVCLSLHCLGSLCRCSAVIGQSLIPLTILDKINLILFVRYASGMLNISKTQIKHPPENDVGSVENI